MCFTPDLVTACKAGLLRLTGETCYRPVYPDSRAEGRSGPRVLPQNKRCFSQVDYRAVPKAKAVLKHFIATLSAAVRADI